jgi:hypothetical protein
LTARIIGEERLRPPAEYVEHLTQLGGLNRFSEPNFILAWGQTRTIPIWGQDGNGRRGQHIRLQFNGMAAWHILAWKPPECFGTPDLWDALTWDQEAGTYTIGEFPYRGDYAPCRFNLYVKRIEGGGLSFDSKGNLVEHPTRLVVDAMPLAHWVLDLLIPNVIKEQDITVEQRQIAVRNRMEVERRMASDQAFAAYQNAAPAWGGAASSKESNREAWMQRIKEKQAGMALSADEIKRKMGIGHRQF